MKNVNNVHSICAYMQVWNLLTFKSDFMGENEISMLKDFIENNFSKSNIGKRTVFSQAIFTMIIYHVNSNNEKIFQKIIELLPLLPNQIFEWKNSVNFECEKHIFSIENTQVEESDGFIENFKNSFDFSKKTLFFLIKNISQFQEQIKIQGYHRRFYYCKIFSYLHQFQSDQYAHILNQYTFSFIDDFLQQKISNIYTNQLLSYSKCTKRLIKLTQILSFFSKTTLFVKIYSYVLPISPDLVSYLVLRISSPIESPQYNEMLLKKSEFQNLLYYLNLYATHPDVIQPNQKLCCSVEKILVYMLKELREGTLEERKAILYLYLSGMFQCNINLIEDSLQQKRDSIFIHESIFTEGTLIIKNIFNKNIFEKNHFTKEIYIFVCTILPLLSFGEEKISLTNDQILLLLDIFDEKYYFIYFQMLKYTLNKSINNFDFIYQLFERIFDDYLLPKAQNNPLTYLEIYHLFQWALDQNLLLNDEALNQGFLQKIVQKSLILAKRYWLIQRIALNQLFSVLIENPQILIHFQKPLLKLIKMSEYRGFDSSIVLQEVEEKMKFCNEVKQKTKKEMEYFGVFSRFFTLSFIENIISKEWYKDEKVKEFLIQFTFALIEYNFLPKYIKNTRNSLLKISSKLRVWQCLCLIKNFWKKENNFDIKIIQRLKEKLWEIINFNNQIAVRQYIEIFLLHFYQEFPSFFQKEILKAIQEPNNKTQYQIPLVFIAGYQMCKYPQQSQEIFNTLFPYLGSHQAYLRALSQYFIFKYLIQNEQQIKQEKDLLQSLYKFNKENKEALKLQKVFEKTINKYTELIENFTTENIFKINLDGNGDIVHESIIEKIKEICTQQIADVKQQENVLPKQDEIWKIIAEESIENDVKQKEIINYQRKIDQIENENLIFEREKIIQSQKKEIIVVASLLDKIPNIAHLTRTGEVFGVTQLIIPNKQILQVDEFKTVSVTAEKWIPMMEIKEEDLLHYLHFKKKQGFTLIGLEQTQQSQLIQNFTFPNKCVLLLGREKTGIPLEYIEILDNCVEIPQFGQIRSLNVHISAVICIWEFVKQSIQQQQK